MPVKKNRKAVWGWISYDWAAQPFHTLLITFIFAPYFASEVVGDTTKGQAIWGYMITCAGVVIAVMAPIIGALADTIGPRKPWIAIFSVLFLIGSFPLWLAVPSMNDITFLLVLFAIGLIGVEFSQIFVNAMLPDLVQKSETGRISGLGWGMGYAGGVLALFIMLLFFAENDQGVTLLGRSPALGFDPETREGTRFVGPFTGFWFTVFMIPFFFFVTDVKRQPQLTSTFEKSIKDLIQTLKTLPQNISLFAYLGSSMFYRDALNGIYVFGGIYAKGVLGWSLLQIGIFGIVAAITGAIFCWIGGYIDRAIGPKKVIIFCVGILIIVCTVIVGTSRDAVFGVLLSETSTLSDRLFMICGACIGAAGGMLQASSRTMMIFQADKDRMTEAFGLYALAGRATAFLAPGLIALFTDLTGSQRLGILPVILLFSIGLILLIWVDPGEDY